MERLKVGNVQITWLNGGVTHLDGGAMFGVVPKPLWSKKYPCNDNNQIELRTDPLLLQVANKNILIDSGVGNGKLTDKQKRNFGVTEESSIEKSLHELGLTPNDVDFVLMTHMHFDHACGLTKRQGNQFASVFPNAQIVTSQVEWNEMREPNIRSRNTYWKENWEAIAEQVVTFAEEIEIVSEIKMIHTGGHSDGHSIIHIESEGERLVHLADLMPTHAHQNVLWVLAYDDYPMTSIAQKQKWIPYAVDQQAWLSFYHDAYYRAIKWNEAGEMIASVAREREKEKASR
ncbi:MBL fold metallo-hydrolase [Anoxybacillus rupiensis]|jgi:glyoxylase-like metal-dependent hydrolase (beta-lactamase superfamily II)|uniref:MBL fold metallo-hydrolase n=1 Tax=Anoxybacteroides rupiense TaxID=311460 RepID=A0ABD5ISC8_9BACL|nr:MULTISPECIES: MBL fold metallo-hydrolase [Anoxybacillus]KXG08850.1 putative quorum-quenching lactonase YtnP [Anoxybacillus sp. P3H1B]MBB3907013.1 glyoxylase-like metal-dependent hydrolase (beta-lactamase superfamily II) [Anoxybacillus rupiensis]MBS2771459.1 MBL fold metallo-hydrolase [Anoxybacillus rupiensis]MDE8564698.1 MBL fold metallo-hydrolase [Anoxybacillus rupiensis]MED5051200.1 MBL fold metallo-hydrolase [Anoxybacillus rupiensis]